MYPISSQIPRNDGRQYLHCQVEDRIVWTFAETQRCLSWAIQGGGYQKTRSIVWLQVRNEDLPLGISPLDCIRRRLDVAPSTPVFLTSAQIASYGFHSASHDAIRAEALATVGLGNAMRAGDQVNVPPYFGTINLACVLSQKLSDSAMLEALCIMTEAKAAALHDAGIRSRISDLPATGTGTDCQAILCPDEGYPAIYAGKHTGSGSAIGSASYHAVLEGIRKWQEGTWAKATTQN